jgi:hypothetical protein
MLAWKRFWGNRDRLASQEEAIRDLLREAGADHLPNGYIAIEGETQRFAFGDTRP